MATNNTYKSGSLGLIDAVSQSFSVDTPGGEFLTSVELFFQTVDPEIPVTVHIRTMANGTPTSVVLPFSETTLKKGVAAVATYDSSGNLTNSTKFTFDAPVYVEQNTEYAICIMANSKDYNVYVSEIGQDRLGTKTRISSQPSSGVFFTSQNSSTWLPNPFKDLAYKLNRAKFKNSSPAYVTFVNTEEAPDSMKTNPFELKISDGYIHINHYNHGFKIGDKFYLTNDAFTSANVDLTHTEGSYTVGTVISSKSSITGEDRYVIEGTVSAITSPHSFKTNLNSGVSGATEDLFGGSGWSIYKVYNYNSLIPTIESLNFNSTGIAYEANTKTGVESGMSGLRSITANNFSLINEGEENKFETIRSVEGQEIERDLDEGDIFIRATLFSNSPYQTPIIDLDRTSVLISQNLISNVNQANYTFSDVTAETDPSLGAEMAKYVTREVVLNEPAQNLKLYCDVNAPLTGSTTVRFYYKAGSADQDFLQIAWTEFDAVTPVANTDDSESFPEVEFNSGTAAEVFDKYVVKIVMTSEQSAYVPRCKNLRVIAYT